MPDYKAGRTDQMRPDIDACATALHSTVALFMRGDRALEASTKADSSNSDVDEARWQDYYTKVSAAVALLGSLAGQVIGRLDDDDVRDDLLDLAVKNVEAGIEQGRADVMRTRAARKGRH